MTAPVAPAPVPAFAAPSLRRNFSWTLAGNVVYAACQWGILVVLAKLVSAEMVGQFVLGVAVAAPVFLLANLNLGSILATDSKRTLPLQTYLRLRAVTTAGAVAALAVVAAACGYPARTAAVVMIVAAAKAMDAGSDVLHSYYQQQERMRFVSASLMCNGVVSLAGAALAVWLTRDVVWAAAAFATGSAAALLGYNVPTAAAVWRSRRGAGGGDSLWASVFRGGWDWPALGRLAWMAAPVGVAAGLVSLNASVPRYFVKAHLGDAPLGVFAALAYVMTAGVTFVGSLCHAAVPRMARYYAGRDFASFDRLVLKVAGVALAVGAGGVVVAAVAGRQLLTVLYRPEYAEQSAVFTWVMAAAAVNYVAAVLGYAVNAARAFRMLTVPYALVTAATLAACAALIPPYGLRGAAWAVGLSGLAACAAGLFILLRLRGSGAPGASERDHEPAA